MHFHPSSRVLKALTWAVMLWGSYAQASPIVSAEYFIGSDPGAGSGTPMVLADTTALATGFVQVSLSLEGRPPGTYSVGIRVKDDQNRWSNASLRRFTIQPKATLTETLAGLAAAESNQELSDAAPVSYAEYFIGNDPGAGNGTALALTDTQSLGSGLEQVSLSLIGRTPGTYAVGIRVRDDESRWSNPLLRRFTILASGDVTETTALVEASTNSVDQAPAFTVWSLSLGAFAGNQITLNAGGFSLIYTRRTGETNAGFVRRVRAALEGNAYINRRFLIGPMSAEAFTLTAKLADSSMEFPLSSAEFQVTRITDGTLGSDGRKIIAAEYFWDLDPGKGAGTPISISTSGNDATFSTQSLSLSDLSGGSHRLGIRYKNAAGRWSNPVYRGLSSFVLFGDQDTTPPVITLTGDSVMSLTQGAVFTDPGATANDGVDGDISSKVVATITIDPSQPGTQTIEYAVVDRAGNIAKIQRLVDVATVIPNPDYNSNSMPDWWEDQYFSGETLTSTADADGDGTSNLMEYLAGTDPKDTGSVFRPIGSLVGMIYTMPIPTVEDRNYKIWVSRDLNDWVLGQTFVGDGSVKNFTFDERSITSGPLFAPTQKSGFFFRVEISEP